MSVRLMKVTWRKKLNCKCDICGKGQEDTRKESNVIVKYFIGVPYCKVTVCQGCISKMLRNFTKGL